MDHHTKNTKDSHSLNPTFVNLGFDGEKGENLESSRKSGFEGTKKDSSITLKTSQPVTYSWESIEIYLEKQQGNCFKRQPPIQKRILDNVTGCVRPGEFLAIMGASGAGKTTLLNCLTFRNTGKLKISGERFLNGAKVNTDTLARISGYVQQDDLFVSTLTVKEHLEFQALLRMEKHLSYNERMIRVGEVIHELGLTKCENTVIGNPERGIKGISGGERKRLAFASEVLTNPSLMFCDEPTSGLDSYMAQNIVQVLKNIASTGKTVICTIHQPSSEVFALFDRILLMAEGRTAFLGPVGDALSFFSAQGLPCPPNYNPADYYIHTLATVPGQEIESRKKSKEICDAYESSQAGQQVLEIVKANRSLNSTESQEFELAEVKVKKTPYKASWFAQFRAVLWRSVISVLREPVVLRVKAFQTIFISAIIALIYQGQTLQYDNVRNIQGALFIFLTNMTFQNVFGVVNAITSELPIFLREHFNGMYRTDIYFICKSIADLPLFIIFPFIFVAIPYFAIGLNPAADRFFIACGIIILVANVASSFGFMISCVAGSTDVALALAPPLIIPLLLFGGFFLSNEDVPVYFDWMRYISWFMYGNEALSINQWVGVSFNDTNCPNEVCTGEQILASFDFNQDYFYRDIGGLFALIIGFRLLAFLGLLTKTYRKN